MLQSETPQQLSERDLSSSQPSQTTQKLHRNYTEPICVVPYPPKLHETTQKLHRNYTVSNCTKLHRTNLCSSQPSRTTQKIHRNYTEPICVVPNPQTTQKLHRNYTEPICVTKQKLHRNYTETAQNQSV